jgi:hypothetical protein
MQCAIRKTCERYKILKFQRFSEPALVRKQPRPAVEAIQSGFALVGRFPEAARRIADSFCSVKIALQKKQGEQDERSRSRP